MKGLFIVWLLGGGWVIMRLVRALCVVLCVHGYMSGDRRSDGAWRRAIRLFLAERYGPDDLLVFAPMAVLVLASEASSNSTLFMVGRVAMFLYGARSAILCWRASAFPSEIKMSVIGYVPMVNLVLLQIAFGMTLGIFGVSPSPATIDRVAQVIMLAVFTFFTMICAIDAKKIVEARDRAIANGHQPVAAPEVPAETSITCGPGGIGRYLLPALGILFILIGTDTLVEGKHGIPWWTYVAGAACFVPLLRMRISIYGDVIETRAVFVDRTIELQPGSAFHLLTYYAGRGRGYMLKVTRSDGREAMANVGWYSFDDIERMTRTLAANGHRNAKTADPAPTEKGASPSGRPYSPSAVPIAGGGA